MDRFLIIIPKDVIFLLVILVLMVLLSGRIVERLIMNRVLVAPDVGVGVIEGEEVRENDQLDREEEENRVREQLARIRRSWLELPTLSLSITKQWS